MRWFAGFIALLVAGVVLAGCSGPEATADVPAPTEAPEKERLSRPGRGGDQQDDDEEEDEGEDDLDDATLWSFSEEFDLTVTALTAVIDFGGLDSRNCLAVEGAPFRILGGNATVTWAAQSPAAQELSFTTRQVYGDYYYDQAYGASPLDVDIPDLPEALDDGYFVFSVDAGAIAGAAYEQPVHLSLAFEYEAYDEVSVHGC